MPPLQHSTMLAITEGQKTTLLVWGGLNTDQFSTTNTAFKFTEKGGRLSRNPSFDLTMFKARTLQTPADADTQEGSVPTGIQ